MSPERAGSDTRDAVNRRAQRHRESASLHEAAAARHDQAVWHWTEIGDEPRAEFERRNARIERDAAELERDRAAYEEEHPLKPPDESR